MPQVNPQFNSGVNIGITRGLPQENPSMVWPALIGGAATLLGGVLQNKQQKASAKRQMQFQERMSSTAHQREVKDLRLAGLNPILSGTGGSGASSPGGAQAQMVNALGPAVASALQVSRVQQELKLLTAQTQHTTMQKNALKWASEISRIKYKALQRGGGLIESLISGGSAAGPQQPGFTGGLTREWIEANKDNILPPNRRKK